MFVFQAADDHSGGLAQMVERSLSMREVTGSTPVSSKRFVFDTTQQTIWLDERMFHALWHQQ